MSIIQQNSAETFNSFRHNGKAMKRNKGDIALKSPEIYRLETEQKALRLMLKHTDAIKFFVERGATPEWFDRLHIVLIRNIFDEYKATGYKLTRERFKHNLEKEFGSKSITMLDPYDASWFTRGVVIDDISLYLDLIRENGIARESAKALEAYDKAIDTDGYAAAAKQLQEQLAEITAVAATDNPIVLIGPEDLDDVPDIEWIWDGFIAKGTSTQLTAEWKAGKTTILSHVLKTMLNGGGIVGTKIKPASCLFITEEDKPTWKPRRHALNLNDKSKAIKWISQHFFCPPDYDDWLTFCKDIARVIRQHRFDVVVVDTISPLWPVENENDARQVTKALMPTRLWTDEGAAVIFLHHPSKGKTTVAKMGRGSGAFQAFVHTVMVMRRASEDLLDRTRIIEALGRSSETPAKLIVQLSEDGTKYTTLESVADVIRNKRIEIITSILPTGEPGITADEVLEAWPEDEKPSLKSVRRYLHDGLLTEWKSTGKGKKGSPQRWYQD